MPWFLGYIASWREAAKHDDLIETLYEDLIADFDGTVRLILSFLGNESLAQFSGIYKPPIPKQNTKFNVGKAGRGDESLTSEQKEKIRELAYAYRVNLGERGTVLKVA